MNAPHTGDKSAAFTGLILGGITIFVLLFAIVRLTNAHYNAEKAEAGHEGAIPAAAPAGSAPAH